MMAMEQSELNRLLPLTNDIIVVKTLLEDGADILSRDGFETGLTILLIQARISTVTSWRADAIAICKLVVNHQKQINAAIETTLLCLNRVRRDSQQSAKMRISTGELYRQFKTLLLPHLGPYLPIQQLLNMRDHENKRAYDHLRIDCLRPAAQDYLESACLPECSVQ